ncbi:hypothetical protein FQN60_002848 [Etheostoma spectabile]|uniref:Uncharacterized protein n=1 Tax=Etheostoma spectabile TaxID=54343 RepID=A0A5J5CHR9_9PERO|nr:hypothetical protein FQN60_002848 [Etheostoma spectabile]
MNKIIFVISNIRFSIVRSPARLITNQNEGRFIEFEPSMKNRELLEVSHGHVCPLAVQPVCLGSAHRRSGREKKDRLKIN